MKNLIYCFSLALYCLTSTQVFSQTTFTGANSTDWADPGNWDNGLPTNENDATIPTGFIVELDDADPLWADFNINNNGTLNILGTIMIALTLNNFGVLNNHGFVELALISGEFNNYGVMTNNNGSGIWIISDFHNFGAMDNFGIIDVSNYGYFVNEEPGIIFNYGLIRRNVALGGTIGNVGIVANCGGTFIWGELTPISLDYSICPELCDGEDNNGNGQVDEGCGCTDAQACNFNSSATADDGSCIYPGCTNPSACNYNPSAACSDLTLCTWPGCLQVGACNYDPAFGCDNNECLWGGCEDPLACNYYIGANCDDGSCFYSWGCTDPGAVNFDDNACSDNGLCIYVGCTNPEDPNFDPQAMFNDGSCLLVGLGCPGDFNGDLAINTTDLLGFLSVFGGVCE
jgi:hypothetical protein